MGLDDVYDARTSDLLFYPAKPPAHWLMVAEVAGGSWSSRSPHHVAATRPDGPIVCYEDSPGLANTYRRDRDEY